MKLSAILAGSLVFLLQLSCHADTTKNSKHSMLSWVTSYGVSLGGAEKIRSLYNPYLEQLEITGLAFLGIGAEVKLKHTPFSLQTIINTQFDQSDAQRGDANFDYHTLDTLAFYRQGKHRFGMGMTQHYNPRFYFDNQAKQATRFKNTNGSMLEYNFRYNKKTAVGLRFTKIRYQPLASRHSIDGSNINLFIKTFY